MTEIIQNRSNGRYKRNEKRPKSHENRNKRKQKENAKYKTGNKGKGRKLDKRKEGSNVNLSITGTKMDTNNGKRVRQAVQKMTEEEFGIKTEIRKAFKIGREGAQQK